MILAEHLLRPPRSFGTATGRSAASCWPKRSVAQRRSHAAAADEARGEGCTWQLVSWNSAQGGAFLDALASARATTPMNELGSAIERLKAFRCTLYDGDVIDETSGLQVADLDIIIAAADEQSSVRAVTLDELPPAPREGGTS